ncbi:hypothetical protein BJ742DRAFT_779900 [Cladochytrium replicatum]|nr:hypothetical protein BJ742DRAFT_779900 [Cladochytrium replicatum]
MPTVTSIRMTEVQVSDVLKRSVGQPQLGSGNEFAMSKSTPSQSFPQQSRPEMFLNLRFDPPTILLLRFCLHPTCLLEEQQHPSSQNPPQALPTSPQRQTQRRTPSVIIEGIADTMGCTPTSQNDYFEDSLQKSLSPRRASRSMSIFDEGARRACGKSVLEVRNAAGFETLTAEPKFSVLLEGEPSEASKPQTASVEDESASTSQQRHTQSAEPENSSAANVAEQYTNMDIDTLEMMLMFQHVEYPEANSDIEEEWDTILHKYASRLLDGDGNDTCSDTDAEDVGTRKEVLVALNDGEEESHKQSPPLKLAPNTVDHASHFDVEILTNADRLPDVTIGVSTPYVAADEEIARKSPSQPPEKFYAPLSSVSTDEVPWSSMSALEEHTTWESELAGFAEEQQIEPPASAIQLVSLEGIYHQDHQSTSYATALTTFESLFAQQIADNEVPIMNLRAFATQSIVDPIQLDVLPQHQSVVPDSASDSGKLDQNPQILNHIDEVDGRMGWWTLAVKIVPEEGSPN